MTPEQEQQLITSVARIEAAVELLMNQSQIKPAAPAAVEVPAYERPEMRANDNGLVVDGHTFNADGSVWAVNKGGMFTPGEGAGNGVGTPSRIIYGYISPKKNPDLWEMARNLLAPEQFKAWEDQWKADPYQVYAGNPADLARHGTPVNFMLFSYAMKIVTSVRQ